MTRAVVTFLNPAGGAVPAIDGAELFVLDAVQPLPGQEQPWRMAALHWPDDPTADLAAIGLALASDPAIADHASHVFDCVAPWRMAANAQGGATHLIIVMANAVPGRDAGYHRWYDDHHTPDVIATPGVAGVWRGKLAQAQVQSHIPHPAGYVVLVAAATDDPQTMLGEMAARTMGTSASGIRYAPRSEAVSDDRTIHFFRKL